MKNKEYHNVGTVQKSNREIVERGKLDTTYMTAHFSLLKQAALQ
jgi:poly(3-hydroxyalkanoate) synthetase